MIHYSSCPVCTGTDLEEHLSVKDHSVSQKTFFIWHCNNCSLRFTQDIPAQEEAALYYQSENYISHTNTKQGFINQLYHIVRRLTLSSKKRLVIAQTSKHRGKILDIGCGTGAFLHTMEKDGWHVTGLEPDAAARGKARELYQLEPQSVQHLFELAPASYDAITLWHVLEHVHELQAYIKQVALLLQPGGKLFIAVPNYTSYDAAVYKEYWAAWDVPRHLYHFSPASMKKLLNRHGLCLDAVKPMWFDSFYVSMLSEKYKNGKGNMIRACWIGFLSNLKAMRNNEKCSSLIYIISRTTI